MSMNLVASNPADLLAKIKKAIDDKKVETWSYDADGDFTHTPDQWANKAWMRPQVSQGMLIFGILGQKGVVMTKVIYGVYHGRFLEMLLTHFDLEFSSALTTALGSGPDNYKTAP